MSNEMSKSEARTVRNGDPPFVLRDIRMRPWQDRAFNIFRRGIPAKIPTETSSILGGAGGRGHVRILRDETLQRPDRPLKVILLVIFLWNPRRLRCRRRRSSSPVEEIHCRCNSNSLLQGQQQMGKESRSALDPSAAALPNARREMNTPPPNRSGLNPLSPPQHSRTDRPMPGTMSTTEGRRRIRCGVGEGSSALIWRRRHWPQETE
jgi:hypothetical protein